MYVNTEATDFEEVWLNEGLSHIAEELGGVSRNAVIGKAHRLGLQSRPSPVKVGRNFFTRSSS